MALKLAVETLSYVSLVAYALLAVATINQWRLRRDRAAAWAAGAFGALGVVVVLGKLVPMHPQGLAQHFLQKLDIAILLLFPYLLHRFTTCFRSATSRLEQALGLMTVVMLVWTFALPSIPASGEPRSALFIAYLVGFMIHWTVLSTVAAVRLWRAGLGRVVRDRHADRHAHRLRVALRAVLRQRRAARARDARGVHGHRARPRPALPAGARGACRPRARRRDEDELHRARLARAADTGDDDSGPRVDAEPGRRPARQRPAARAAPGARAPGRQNGDARRAAARPLAPRRGGDRDLARAVQRPRAARGDRVGGGAGRCRRRAGLRAARSGSFRRSLSARPDRLESRHQRAPVRLAAGDRRP